MNAFYPTVRVPDDALRLDEVLGTKDKFWYPAEPGEDPPSLLFKHARPNEDWSEKVAAELADLLRLPHAPYALGAYRQLRGVVTRSFVAPGETLIHGNEVLAELDPSYPMQRKRGALDHTVERVFDALDGFRGPLGGPDAMGARGVFVGYLLFDAWIGNTDRHHENWGLVHGADGDRLAPTFDHATCLGRELRADVAAERLMTRDRRRTVEAYAKRARSALFPAGSRPGTRPLAPLAAWQRAREIEPDTASHWRRVLEMVDDERIMQCIQRVPDDRISAAHRAFARRILDFNRTRICDE